MYKCNTTSALALNPALHRSSVGGTALLTSLVTKTKVLV